MYLALYILAELGSVFNRALETRSSATVEPSSAYWVELFLAQISSVQQQLDILLFKLQQTAHTVRLA